MSSTTVVSWADFWCCAVVGEDIVMFVGCRQGDMDLREARAEAEGPTLTLYLLSIRKYLIKRQMELEGIQGILYCTSFVIPVLSE